MNPNFKEYLEFNLYEDDDNFKQLISWAFDYGLDYEYFATNLSASKPTINSWLDGKSAPVIAYRKLITEHLKEKYNKDNE